jgi:hypothetical protein
MKACATELKAKGQSKKYDIVTAFSPPQSAKKEKAAKAAPADNGDEPVNADKGEVKRTKTKTAGTVSLKAVLVDDGDEPLPVDQKKRLKAGTADHARGARQKKFPAKLLLQKAFSTEVTRLPRLRARSAMAMARRR